MKLYELTLELQELERELEANGGELEEAALDRYLELEAAIPVKVEQLCKFIANLDGESAFASSQAKALQDRIAGEVDRLNKLSESKAKAANRVRDRLKAFIVARNGESVSTPMFTVKLNKSGGSPKVIFPQKWEIMPETAPAEVQNRKIEVNKKQLRLILEEREVKLAEAVTDEERDAILEFYAPYAGCSFEPRPFVLAIK